MVLPLVAHVVWWQMIGSVSHRRTEIWFEADEICMVAHVARWQMNGSVYLRRKDYWSESFPAFSSYVCSKFWSKMAKKRFKRTKLSVTKRMIKKKIALTP